MKSPRFPAHVSLRGFAQLEVLLSLLAGSCLLGSLLAGLVFLHRSLMPPRLLDGGRVLALAPAYAPLPAALRMQEAFLAHLEEARAVYVLGGRHAGLGDAASSVQTHPLAIEILPEISDFSPGLPRDSASFHALYAAELGQLREDAGEDEFSILVIGPRQGRTSLLCMVHSRATELGQSGLKGKWRRREVMLCSADGSRLGYSFAEPADSMNSSGATHTWYRFDEAAGIREEGPACVVFPDPVLLRGFSGEGGKPGSRFTHFLSLSP